MTIIGVLQGGILIAIRIIALLIIQLLDEVLIEKIKI